MNRISSLPITEKNIAANMKTSSNHLLFSFFNYLTVSFLAERWCKNAGSRETDSSTRMQNLGVSRMPRAHLDGNEW